jgi:hypothetical protein
VDGIEDEGEEGEGEGQYADVVTDGMRLHLSKHAGSGFKGV